MAPHIFAVSSVARKDRAFRKKNCFQTVEVSLDDFSTVFMDTSGGSSISSLGASEATKLLKEMLKMGGLENPSLGKSRSESSGKYKNFRNNKHAKIVARFLIHNLHYKYII